MFVSVTSELAIVVAVSATYSNRHLLFLFSFSPQRFVFQFFCVFFFRFCFCFVNTALSYLLLIIMHSGELDAQMVLYTFPLSDIIGLPLSTKLILVV